MIGVKHALAMANVRLVHNDGSTTLRVHGSGLIINRVVNDLVLARQGAFDSPGLPRISAVRTAMTGTSGPCA